MPYDATRAEYVRFGSVVISMARRSKSPATLFYWSTRSGACYCAPMIWLLAPNAAGA
jgi:hypothetical protein